MGMWMGVLELAGRVKLLRVSMMLLSSKTIEIWVLFGNIALINKNMNMQRVSGILHMNKQRFSTKKVTDLGVISICWPSPISKMMSLLDTSNGSSPAGKMKTDS